MLKWFWGIKRHLISSWRVDFSCKHRTHTEARCWFILREVRHNVSPWGSPRRSSRDGPVTFSHALCVVTQVTQLVLAELCDVLRPGQQHVWHTQTQTHTHAVSTWPLDDTPPPVTLRDNSLNAELWNKEEKIWNPVFITPGVWDANMFMLMLLINGLQANVIKGRQSETTGNLSLTSVRSLTALLTNMFESLSSLWGLQLVCGPDRQWLFLLNQRDIEMSVCKSVSHVRRPAAFSFCAITCCLIYIYFF